MTQTLPAALIAPARTGLTVGYRLLTTTLTQYQAFTTAGVTESAPGSYVVSGGVSAPDPGGYIQWGVSSGGSLGEVLGLGVLLPAPVLATDTRLGNLDATVSSRATAAAVAAIPTNPVRTTDTRLDNLDRAISTRQPRLGWPP